LVTHSIIYCRKYNRNNIRFLIFKIIKTENGEKKELEAAQRQTQVIDRKCASRKTSVKADYLL
jgi:hypothetical protein